MQSIEITPPYLARASVISWRNIDKCGNEAAGASSICSWRLCLRNPPHASHNLFIQAFFTPLTGSRGTLTAYSIDEFGVAVPLIIVLIAIGLWLKHRPALHLQGAAA